jgi:hypothetical protein
MKKDENEGGFKLGKRTTKSIVHKDNYDLVIGTAGIF